MNNEEKTQLGDLFAKTPDGMKGTVAYVMASTAIGTLMRMLDSLLSHTRQGTAEERLASAAVHDLKVDLLAAVGKFEEACKAAEKSRQEKMKEEFAETLPKVSMCRSETMPEEKKFKSGEMVTIEGIIGCFLVRDQNGENVLVTMDGKKVWMHVSLVNRLNRS